MHVLCAFARCAKHMCGLKHSLIAPIFVSCRLFLDALHNRLTYFELMTLLKMRTTLDGPPASCKVEKSRSAPRSYKMTRFVRVK